MIFHFSLTHVQKIVKENICSEQTRFKTRVAKYHKKIYLNCP
jgi:hypothetical protein